jgi:hypothetical protein
MDFFVGVTLLAPSSADQLIGGLVKRGFNVALAQEGFHGHQLVALRVSDADPDNEGVAGTYDDELEDESVDNSDHEYAPEDLDLVKAALVQTLNEYQLKYFSYVVISGDAIASWAPGNLDLAPKQESDTLFEHVTGD